MVTIIKSAEATPKRKPRTPRAVVGATSAASARTRSPRRTTASKDAVEDAAYARGHEEASKAHTAAAPKQRLSDLAARGKDMVSGDAASIATTAAIVVGAALIEIELIPGLIIGAGAILLGKFFPEMGGYVRPALKGAIRAGFFMAQKTREVMAEASEQVHDLVAEVVLENVQGTVTKKAPPAPAPAPAPSAAAEPMATAQPTA